VSGCQQVGAVSSGKKGGDLHRLLVEYSTERVSHQVGGEALRYNLELKNVSVKVSVTQGVRVDCGLALILQLAKCVDSGWVWIRPLSAHVVVYPPGSGLWDRLGALKTTIRDAR
jgi:hypothetical protein